VLQRLLSQGWHGEKRAWELFNEMVDRGEANEFHTTVMLKVTCCSMRWSTEVRLKGTCCSRLSMRADTSRHVVYIIKVYVS
jgi:hypothetical protein